MKTFKEYWNGLLFGREGLDKNVIEQVWNHAQKELKEENEKMKELLKNACRQISASCKYDESWGADKKLDNSLGEYRENGNIDPDLYRYSGFKRFLSINRKEIKSLGCCEPY